MSRKDPLPRVTPSSINDLSCKKKFRTLRVLNQWPPGQPNFASLYGSAAHAVLRDVYDYNPELGVPPNLPHVETFAKQAFFRINYADKSARQADIQRCVQMVRGYVASDDPEAIEGTLAVEQQGSFEVTHEGLPAFILEAKLDRIIVRESEPKKLVVRDYKTGRPRVNLEEAFVQLWVAKLLYSKYDAYELELDWIDHSGLSKRDIVTTADVRGLYLLNVQKVLAIRRGADYPEPGDHCTYCPLRAACQPTTVVSLSEAIEGMGG